MADRASKIQNFVDLSSLPRKQAEQILERYDWNLEEAVQAFLAGDMADDDEMDADLPVPGAAAAGAASSSSSAGKSKASMMDVWNDEKQKKQGKDGQYFYVGGEHSGEIVIGPDRKDRSEMVKRLFDAAKEHGAEPVAPDEDTHNSKAKVKPFGGSGFRLGSNEENSTAPAPSAEPRRPRTYRLRMWENGFSIDDGELRTYDTPENQRFLSAITQGRIPDELLRQSGGAEVHVDLEDRRTEEFNAPEKPKVVAFSGHGNRLGSVVPPMVTDPTPAAQAASKPREEFKLQVDESQPTTTIQIRLADGSRLVTRANHTHTISQIREFICRSRPHLASSPFILMTMFPNKELTDDGLTLAAAGLLNAAIVQRASRVS